MSNQLETLEMKELAVLLHCHVRTVQRRIKDIKLGLCDPDALPPGIYKSRKWIWLRSVVFQWLSPIHTVHDELQVGSLGQLAQQIISSNKARKNNEAENHQ